MTQPSFDCQPVASPIASPSAFIPASSGTTSYGPFGAKASPSSWYGLWQSSGAFAQKPGWRSHTPSAVYVWWLMIVVIARDDERRWMASDSGSEYGADPRVFWAVGSSLEPTPPQN